ncbi:30S ribosome-binding factor RbfA [Candidatus Kuenenbacteria bacterium]|nr:30S ribosome-binding factor RbfA [Candidatus Kuenenbacteria bacterium]
MILNVRVQQINEVIRQELNQIILREVEFDLGTMTTIIGVDTDPELKITKVFLRVFPENKEKESLKILNKRAPLLQALLNKKIHLRHVPHIKFFIDIKGKREDEKEERIEELFEEIEKNN